MIADWAARAFADTDGRSRTMSRRTLLRAAMLMRSCGLHVRRPSVSPNRYVPQQKTRRRGDKRHK